MAFRASFRSLTGWQCILRPNTEGLVAYRGKQIPPLGYIDPEDVDLMDTMSTRVQDWCMEGGAVAVRVGEKKVNRNTAWNRFNGCEPPCVSESEIRCQEMYNINTH
jgi:hypothetical protein